MLKSKYFRIGVSLLIALAVTFFIFQNAESTGNVKYREAVIAQKEIPQNEKLSSKNLKIENLPEQGIPKKTLKKIPEGKIAAVDIYPGQYIIPEMLSEKKTVKIKPQHRIYPIPVTLKNAGWVNEKDMVDVIWSPKEKRKMDTDSKVIVSGVIVDKILNSSGKRIIQKPGVDEIEEEINPKVAELLVTVEQAKKLSRAATSGVLSLARYKPESKPVKTETKEKKGGETVVKHTEKDRVQEN